MDKITSFKYRIQIIGSSKNITMEKDKRSSYAFKSIFSLPEEFEDTKGVIRIRKSKDRQQKKMDKHRSTKHPHKTKDRVTRTPLKTGTPLVSSNSSGKEKMLLNAYNK
jgi:hypothetical protein